MDKHIMELSESRTKDFFNFSNNPHDQSEEEDDDDDDRSCDFNFHPFRSLSPSSHSHLSTLKNCGLMDHNDSVKATQGKVGTFDNGALISVIDRTMKELSDNLLHAMEGISARLSQLESKTRQLENAMDVIMESAEYNSGRTDGKLRQLENILQKVEDGVQFLRDKQEITEARLQLAKLQCSKGNAQSEDQRSVVQADSMQQVSLSASQQAHQPPPISDALTVAHPVIPPSASSPLPYQIVPPPAAAQLPGQLPQNLIPSRLPASYYSPAEQTPEITLQQYHFPISQQTQSLPPTHHQLYQGALQLPHVSQSSQLPQLHSCFDAVTPQNRSLLSHHPEESPYMPSYSYPPSIPQFPSQPSGAPTQDFFVGSTQQMYGHHLRSPDSEHLIDYSHGLANFGEMHLYGGSPSCYGASTIKSLQLTPAHSDTDGASNYTLLTKAQILPHALPTASSVDEGLDSKGAAGNIVPMDDVVENVTAMGFRRDLVRATVKKLGENGQSVDLNSVLDKLMNNGGIQSQKSWSGR